VTAEVFPLDSGVNWNNEDAAAVSDVAIFIAATSIS
jgi:hypothetical protein